MRDLSRGASLERGRAAALSSAPITEIARAKVNLHLHVTGRRDDGYHLLDSLVVFPELGDAIEVEASSVLSLTIAGTFAGALGAGPDNLVLRAAEALRAEAGVTAGAAIRLTKSLPLASGIGGGSADAAATLRALIRLWRLDLAPARLAALALRLGADVPVCLSAAPRWMSGIGEDLAPAPALPPCWLVLANPLRDTPTPAVFAALTRRDAQHAARPIAPFADAGALAGWLSGLRNDLEPAAEGLIPEIADIRTAIAAQPGCLLARMSGSGATCFGLFTGAEDALAARAALPPRLWRAAAPLGKRAAVNAS
ncbi:MAG: 4-diphosphocytidyl-2-C-methyl-D-erythritol kinase [Paracoccaceae bacterium]|jgi:4-diphosphocytidyl-2-C-methyl-D-erythritol kinase